MLFLWFEKSMSDWIGIRLSARRAGITRSLSLRSVSGAILSSVLMRETVVCDTEFFRLLSVYREMAISFALSIERSSLKCCEIEKDPSFETIPDPLSSPLERSLSSMPVMLQKRVVPGSTFVVSMVVVSLSPLLMVCEEVLIW